MHKTEVAGGKQEGTGGRGGVTAQKLFMNIQLHVDAHTPTLSLSLTHTHTNTPTHTYTHTHPRSHTHIHTPSPPLPPPGFTSAYNFHSTHQDLLQPVLTTHQDLLSVLQAPNVIHQEFFQPASLTSLTNHQSLLQLTRLLSSYIKDLLQPTSLTHLSSRLASTDKTPITMHQKLASANKSHSPYIRL